MELPSWIAIAGSPTLAQGGAVVRLRLEPPPLPIPLPHPHPHPHPAALKPGWCEGVDSLRLIITGTWHPGNWAMGNGQLATGQRSLACPRDGHTKAWTANSPEAAPGRRAKRPESSCRLLIHWAPGRPPSSPPLISSRPCDTAYLGIEPIPASHLLISPLIAPSITLSLSFLLSLSLPFSDFHRHLVIRNPTHNPVGQASSALSTKGDTAANTPRCTITPLPHPPAPIVNSSSTRPSVADTPSGWLQKPSHACLSRHWLR